MKKSFIISALACLFASQAGAISYTDQTPVYTGDENGVAEWNIIDDLEAGTTTYWIKITGNYNIDLGEDAQITMQSGGTLSVYTTNTDWSTDLGIGLTSNTDPYQVQAEDLGQGAQTSHMAVYIGAPNAHPFPCIQYHVNTYNYECTDQGTGTPTHKVENGVGYAVGTNYDKEVVETPLPNTVFSEDAQGSSHTTWDDTDTGTLMTFGFTLGSAMDEAGNITGLRLTVPKEFLTPDYTKDGKATSLSVDETEKGATPVKLTTDMWLDRSDTQANFTDPDGHYVDLPNMGFGFDLTKLVSYGASTINTGSPSYALDPEAVTYIVITKDLRPEAEQIPEPATATLSLLALAGLAARRRRK